MDIIGSMNSGVLFDAVALAAIATFLLSLVKPFVELLPFARVDAPTHDATLRLLNVAINIGLALLAALAAGQLTGSTWLPLILQGLGQAAGAQTLYHTATRSGGSISSGALSVLPLVDHTLVEHTFDVAAEATPAAGRSALPVVTAGQVAAATFTARDATHDAAP